jgi:hypothetical protein
LFGGCFGHGCDGVFGFRNEICEMKLIDRWR